MHGRLFRTGREAPAATGVALGRAPVLPRVPTRRGGQVTTVFFGRQAVRVTDRELIVDDRLYVVAAIDDVRVDARRVHSLGLVVLAVLAPWPMAGAGLAVSGFGPMTLVVAAAGAALSAVAAHLVLKMRPEIHELWISYQGRPHRILETDDDWRAEQLASVVRDATLRV